MPSDNHLMTTTTQIEVDENVIDRNVDETMPCDNHLVTTSMQIEVDENVIDRNVNENDQNFDDDQNNMETADDRYDGYEHFPAFDKEKSSSRCKSCRKTTHVMCLKCSKGSNRVNLCFVRGRNCFNKYHGIQEEPL